MQANDNPMLIQFHAHKKMKLPSKPISSPSRAEKFPPPLMLFSRSNGGSRSRSRSRKSPMFYLRSKKNPSVIESAQEPSSPKVTCIGQVRSRRSRPKTAGGGGGGGGGAATTSRLCRWCCSSRFCRPDMHLHWFFLKCGLFFRCAEGCFGVESIHTRKKKEKRNSEILGAQFQESKRDFLDSSCINVDNEEIIGAQIQESKGDLLESSSTHVDDNNHQEILETQIQENLGAQFQENNRDFLDSSPTHVDNIQQILDAQIQENKNNQEIIGTQNQENNGEFLDSSSLHADNNNQEILGAQMQDNKNNQEIHGDQFQENNRDFLDSSSARVGYDNNNQEILGAQIQENERDFLDSSSSSPPKKALLLTRSRSTPYRSSSLASTFWGSPPLATPEIKNKTAIEAKIEHGFEELRKPFCENVAMESRTGNEVEEFEGSVNNVNSLVLKRCKSEPARTGERLTAEATLRRQKNL